MGMGEGGLEETGRGEVGEVSEGGEGGEGGEGASIEFNDLEVLESEVVMQVLWQDGDGAATAVSLKSRVSIYKHSTVCGTYVHTDMTIVLTMSCLTLDT